MVTGRPRQRANDAHIRALEDVVTNKGELIAGRYRLVSQVGTGAMGVVWQAHDERLHRTVAVKQLLLHSDMSETEADEADRRAMREGRITARLHHPHAITVYDVAEHKGKPCLIMEYLPSESLSTVLAIQGVLSPTEVARIGSQIAAALTAAHRAGIVHRDIKPGNVLIADDGTAKITDFGISRAVGDATVTATGIVAGTPAYLAPEVAQGENAGFASDVFSLGSTLYAAVEGMPPFGLDDNPLALLFRIANGEITPPRQSGPLTHVLTRLLERDPSRRPTMQEAQEALAAVAEHPSSPVPDPQATAVWPPEIEPSPTVGAAAPEPPVTAPEPPAAAPALPVTAPEPPAAAPEPPATAPEPPAAAPEPPAAAPEPPTTAPEPRAEDVTRQQRRPVTAITAVAASLVAVGVILVATLLNGTDPAGTAAGPTSPTPGISQSEQAPQPTATADNPTEAAPSPAPTPGPPTNAGPQDTPEQLRAAVSDYYALMPGNLQEGWTRLTANYQTNHAGGFSGYQTFWNQMQRVEVSNVSATSPTTVSATLNYFYKDGRVVEEQTNFGLVAEDGLWKIGSSTVLSSRTTQG